MNKTDFVATLATKCEISKAKAAEVVDSIFDANPGNGIIAVELDAGRKVILPGFGTFGTKRRAARVGTNPATGKKIDIPAKNYAFFKPGKTLRDRVAQ
ncbi:MAG: DNA-binding protein HU-beta [Myxococcota bacterium]|jgi:DNA-binding protein HU-beta